MRTSSAEGRKDRSLKMLPRTSSCNTPRVLGSETELTREFASRHAPGVVSITDESHIIRSQFGDRVALAFHVVHAWMRSHSTTFPLCKAILCEGVRVVVDTSTKKQMFRANTRRVVTAVQDAQVIGNIAVMEHPRHAMCEFSFRCWVNAESPIAKRVSASCPDPTVTTSIDLRPESLGKGDILTGHLRLRSRVEGVVVRAVRAAPGRFMCHFTAFRCRFMCFCMAVEA